ncbi:MAG: substrate-binding domain-containing protein [Candidatus Sulfotelmatobacter sp.]
MNGRSISILLLTLLATLAFMPLAAAQGDFAVIVHPDNPITNLSRGDLRKLLNGEKHSWPSGAPVKIIIRGPGCRERDALLKFLNLSESDYKQYWTAQVVRGEVDSEPFVAPSVGMVLEAVRVLPGAIGLVYVGDLKPRVKVVKVDGLLPGTLGYLLH